MNASRIVVFIILSGFLPLPVCPALDIDPNIIEQFRSSKATRIDWFTQDCNDTKKKLAESKRARIVPERKKSSEDSIKYPYSATRSAKHENLKKIKPLTYSSVEDKNKAIDVLKEKLKTSQQNLARVKANDVDIIVDSFQLPFRIGQIGKIGYEQNGYEQWMKIESIRDDNNAIVDFAVGRKRAENAQAPAPLRAVESNFSKFQPSGPPPATVPKIEKIWLKGISTVGLADGSKIENPPILVITGTKDYETGLGTKKTVFVFEPLIIPTGTL